MSLAEAKSRQLIKAVNNVTDMVVDKKTAMLFSLLYSLQPVHEGPLLTNIQTLYALLFNPGPTYIKFPPQGKERVYKPAN